MALVVLAVTHCVLPLMSTDSLPSNTEALICSMGSLKLLVSMSVDHTKSSRGAMAAVVRRKRQVGLLLLLSTAWKLPSE